MKINNIHISLLVVLSLIFNACGGGGGGGSNPSTLTTNKKPIAIATPVSTDTNSSVSITLTATDADNDSLLYTLVAQPTNGTLSGTAPTLTYTPATDYNGNDSFTFKVNDTKADSNIATISITINSTAKTLTPSNSKFIKKTGQTKSYDENGKEVLDGSIKDDGFYQKGKISRYSRVTDIVTDEITGLMWQDDVVVVTLTKPWLTPVIYNSCASDTTSSICVDTSGDTATTYCKDLVLGSYTDWRLPTITELDGIVDYSNYTPAIDSIYVNMNNSYNYWSSTVYSNPNDSTWMVDFRTGNIRADSKDRSRSIRCVRGG